MYYFHLRNHVPEAGVLTRISRHYQNIEPSFPEFLGHYRNIILAKVDITGTCYYPLVFDHVWISGGLAINQIDTLILFHIGLL